MKKEILEVLKSEIAWCIRHNKGTRDIAPNVWVHEKGFIDGLRQAVRLIKKVRTNQ